MLVLSSVFLMRVASLDLQDFPETVDGFPTMGVEEARWVWPPSDLKH